MLRDFNFKRKKEDTNRANLSDFFVFKIKTKEPASAKLAEKHGLKPKCLYNWIYRTNKAPKNDERLLRIAQEVGCPQDKMFESFIY